MNKMSLDDYVKLPTTEKGSFDVVFSTSVLEHVKGDGLFMRQIADLLARFGVGVVTCDFKEGFQVGDPVIGATSASTRRPTSPTASSAV